MDNIKNVIFNRHYYRNVFVICTILFAVAFLNKLSGVLNLFLLAWGGILILQDLFTKRIIFKSKLYIPLFGFMVFAAFTLIINRHMNLFENLKIYVLSLLQFFVLFAFDKDEEEDFVKNNIKNFNTILILSTFLLSSIALIIYILGINREVGGYVIGMEGGTMLTGIYTGANTAGPLAALSIIATLMNIELNEKIFNKKLYYSNLAVQFVFMCMTNSRAAKYSLIVFAVIYALFYFDGVGNKVKATVGVGILYLISKFMNDVVYLCHRVFYITIDTIKFILKQMRHYILSLLG